MLIVGGFYREISIFPADDQLYGSGGRAAAVLSSLSKDVVFHTYVSKERLNDLNLFARRYNIKVISSESEKILTFEYYHGFSTPVIRPTPLTTKKTVPIKVSAKLVLRFGMLDGDAVINAETAVYDPQHPHKPEYFDKNGSIANKLAYVLNRSEILALTGENSIEDAAKNLLKNKKIDALVVKYGAFGALVWEEGGDHINVPAYETPSIWPIGSGDVFASVFAYCWGELGQSAKEAATSASKAAAIYCDERRLNFQYEEIKKKKFPYPVLMPKRKPQDCLIYIAGPFFTMGQYWLVCEARSAFIGCGYKAFSPFHDVGIGDAQDVVQKDIDGLKKSHVIFCLCDGLDSGTLFEAGYAVCEGIPVVAFAENTTDESMKMLKGTDCRLFSDFTSAIYHAQWLALIK